MKKTIRDYELKGKKVIIRCDFNVPIKDNEIVDDTRIVESLETINYAIKEQAKVILMSHLGRIKEESDKSKNSLKIVSIYLSKLLKKEVIFIPFTKGIELETAVSKLENSQVLLIENTRFEDLNDKKESSNNEELGKYWASLGDVFINDAFGTVHRAHASNVGIANKLPNGIGFLIEKELINLEKLNTPIKPFIVILGGAKVNDKIGVIKNLIPKVDKILIGGKMAFTFLKAKGLNINEKMVEEENIQFCKEMLNKYASKIILPLDVNASCDINEATESANKTIEELNDFDLGLDIGILTIQLFKEQLEDAKTIFWNGPLGMYEIEKYQKGTKEVLEFITNLNCDIIVGGGDIVAATTKLGLKNKITHASTGGGATLEYLEGKDLPGLKVIEEK